MSVYQIKDTDTLAHVADTCVAIKRDAVYKGEGYRVRCRVWVDGVFSILVIPEAEDKAPVYVEPRLGDYKTTIPALARTVTL